MLDDVHNESAGHRAKLAVRAKYRMLRRIQNDARDTTNADAQNSKAATLHPRR